MDVKVKPSDLQSAVEEILKDFGDKVYVATDEGLAAAEKVLINNLEAATPVMDQAKAPKGYKDKKLRKGWVGTGKKYRLLRFVGNKVAIEYKGRESPLSSILEYSKEHGHPFIRDTFESSIEEMAAATVATIKKEVQT